jgi:Flp pilus assembly CpaF family ATPase
VTLGVVVEDPGDDSGEIDSATVDDLFRKLAQQLVNVDGNPSRGLVEESAKLVVSEWAIQQYHRTQEFVPDATIDRITQLLVDRQGGLGRLQPLLDDPEIENIDYDGCDDGWVIYAGGRKERGPKLADSDKEFAEIIATAGRRLSPLGERRFDMSDPMLNLTLPDGSRLFAIQGVCDRPSLSIRRHRFPDVSLEDLVGLGALSNRLAAVLKAAVRARLNIVVAGPMNAGKTTLLRALAAEIDPLERIVTVENTYELGLDRQDRHHDCVALQAREANLEGKGEISMNTLVRCTRRMNASRVIVGEVLGDEAIAMLVAMRQGMSGSMCTIHADSSEGVIDQLTMYGLISPHPVRPEEMAYLIAGAVDLIVYASLFETGGDETGTERKLRRVVSSVRNVTGAGEGLKVMSNEVFRPDEQGVAQMHGHFSDQILRRLAAAGYRTGDDFGDGDTLSGVAAWATGPER